MRFVHPCIDIHDTSLPRFFSPSFRKSTTILWFWEDYIWNGSRTNTKWRRKNSSLFWNASLKTRFLNAMAGNDIQWTLNATLCTAILDQAIRVRPFFLSFFTYRCVGHGWLFSWTVLVGLGRLVNLLYVARVLWKLMLLWNGMLNENERKEEMGKRKRKAVFVSIGL